MAAFYSRCRYVSDVWQPYWIFGSGQSGEQLTFPQQLLRHQVVLPVAKDESQEGEDEGVHDAHDGQDVGPAHRAGAQRVLVRLFATHPLHLVAVPAVGVDHAAQSEAGTWNRSRDRWARVLNKLPKENLFVKKTATQKHEFVCYKYSALQKY